MTLPSLTGRSSWWTLPCVLLLVFSLSACKSTESASGDAPEREAPRPGSTDSAVAEVSGTTRSGNQDGVDREGARMTEEEMEKLYWARIDSARMNFTQADVDFMIGMISHHAQALIMCRLAPKNEASPQVQTLCARIINAQNDEIKTMQAWLRRRGQPVPEVHIDGLNLMIHIPGMDHSEHADHTNMPGMLSQQQLVELSEAKGTAFDRLFLRYMIDHHTGAVIMVRNLVSTDGAAQEEDAFRLASDIQVDQTTEIERMKLMLNNLPDPGGRP